ncbi:MAG: glycosyltransferase, partial [Armatimonadetes bacterium]|nr:glycosyltransferase [Armatimonadota bacterium]
MKIMYVITDLHTGGAELQMATLIGHLKDRSQSCHVFTLLSEGSLRDHLGELAVPVYSGGLKKRDLLRAPWKIIYAQMKLVRVVQKQRPSVVHAFLPLATFMGALAGRIARVPLIISSRRALGKHQERHILLRPFDLLANRLSHCVTVNSKAVWEDTIHRDHIDPKKMALIYNGVDSLTFESAQPFRGETRKKLGIKPRERVIIVIANLILYKGHSDLLKA